MSRGFTLIELVIIIVVLGIIAGVAIPRYFDLQSAAMESTIRGFGASLKEASTLYLSRAVLEDDHCKPPIHSFWDFVQLNDGQSSRNTIAINNSIRKLLVNPNAEVLSPDGMTITLNLRGGGVATYVFHPGSMSISETYTGF